MSIRKYKRSILIILSVIMVAAFYVIQDIRYCDKQELSKMVETPSGKHIPYYTNSHSFKSYGTLAGPCSYDSNNKIKCADVRLQGESMNRQALLVIARLHAIFHMICKKRGIKYWVVSGSLIGAQRNGMLIPWDYDSDIGIMMPDFLELLKYIRQDLPDDVFFETGVDTPSMKKHCEARLRDRNSCYGHCFRAGCDRHDGIQIDIFAYKPIKENSTKITNYYYRKVLEYSDVHPISEVNLEGMKLPAPRNATAVNTIMYGKDYMTPPDKDRQQCQKNGYTAIPWYSCETLQAMPAAKRKQILETSMGHRNWFYWYFG